MHTLERMQEPVNSDCHKNLLIVYHSQTGNTHAMAEAVWQGARRVEGVAVRTRQAFAANLEDLLWAHGLLLGTPENFGYMSGALKDFLDRTFYPAQGKTTGLPYAMFISAGNDGSGALASVERIARGYPWKKVCDPVIARGDVDPAVLALCQELGETMATGIAWGIY